MPFSSWFSQSWAPWAMGLPAGSVSTALMRVEPNSTPRRALPASMIPRMSLVLMRIPPYRFNVLKAL